MRGIRRREKAISDKSDIVRILKQAKYITIAMCDDKTPYLVTLSHGYEEAKDRIYIHCAQEGKKVDILRKNNVIWGQAIIDHGYVQGKCDHLYESVHFKGRVSFIQDIDEKRHGLEVMIRQIDETPEKVMEEQLTPESLERVGMGRIDIDYVTGKRSIEAVISM